MADGPNVKEARGRLPLYSIERRVRTALVRGEREEACEAAVGFFGPEIYGFVTAALAGGRGVLDVYADFVAALPEALRDFGWRCELRVFLYHQARLALRRHREGQRTGRLAAMRPPLQEPLAPLPPFRRQRRLAVATLRSALAPDDREVLVLRVDRRLRWSELAVTALGETADDKALRAEARRIRERFLALRQRMKQLTDRDGRDEPTPEER